MTVLALLLLALISAGGCTDEDAKPDDGDAGQDAGHDAGPDADVPGPFVELQLTPSEVTLEVSHLQGKQQQFQVLAVAENGGTHGVSDVVFEVDDESFGGIDETGKLTLTSEASGDFQVTARFGSGPSALTDTAVVHVVVTGEPTPTHATCGTPEPAGDGGMCSPQGGHCEVDEDCCGVPAPGAGGLVEWPICSSGHCGCIEVIVE